MTGADVWTLAWLAGCALWTLSVAQMGALSASAGQPPTGGGGQPRERLLDSATRQSYFGTLVGKLGARAPGYLVAGDVYAVDEQTLFIRGLNYDGRAPDAYFWSSTTGTLPANGHQDGFIVPDEKGSTKPLERYTNKDVVLRLPEGKTLREINWLSIWSRQLKQSIGDIMIPRHLVIPRPLEIAPLSQLAHGVKSGPITIVDAQTFLVSDFHYDGLGPAGYFWLTRGPNGLAANGLRLKDENGSLNPLRKYQGETVVISLPDETTIYDFDYFGVWCAEFQVNFGQTHIPQSAKVPPSPKMLGIKPENKLNCEILYDDLGFEIRWVLDGDDIVMQLVGKIDSGEYMAFGLGKDDSKSEMNNADAVVAWVDRQSGQVHATDYFLGSSKQQCANDPTHGSCPDTKLPGGGDSLTLLHGAIVNGYSMVTFKRPQLGVDDQYDQHVYSDGRQSVIWAIGTLNSHKEIGYHRLRTRSNMFIDFARNPQWNCPIPDLNASMHNNLPITSASQLDQTIVSAASLPDQRTEPGGGGGGSTPSPSSVAPSGAPAPTAWPRQSADDDKAWFIPAIVCPNDRTFFAQIGPSGGRKGVAGLTGRASWGVSWYINGLMIPELVVERGQTYRFVVEGGNDKSSLSRRHPLYLTDSAEGGFNYKTDDERAKERIFGGVALRAVDGQFVPTTEGRLCEWKTTNQTLANPDLYPTFSAYQRSLRLDCLPGQAAVLKFAPDSSTPDLIYYQCYTNRFMGWRVRVVDSCKSYVGSLQQQQAGSAASSSATSSSARVSPNGNNADENGDSNSNSSSSNNNNNNKRERGNKNQLLLDTRFEQQANLADGRQYPGANFDGQHTAKRDTSIDRRQSFGSTTTVDDVLRAQPSEPRMSFEAPPPDNIGTPLPVEFGEELAASSAPLELSNFPITNDMLILNNSLLNQQQPINLSAIEQILKLAPTDFEFLDDNQLDMVNALALASSQQLGQHQAVPLPLQELAAKGQRANKTAMASKMPKSLHSYMRRLAAIYYPVQQSLASMLSAGQVTAAQQNLANNNQQFALLHAGSPGEPSAASSAPASSFSLAKLVPKSKIDLSKSNLSKKLNKLRIKSGRKYEPQQSTATSNQLHVKRPTPANEINYDIFNNQLAQLEKRQKQLQALESMAAASWPPADSFNYMPMYSSATQSSPTDESLVSAMMAGAYQHQAPSQFDSSYQQQQQQQHEHRPRLPPPPRLSVTPLGPPTRFGQQPNVVDYLSMGYNRNSSGEMPPPDHHQHAVFIKRLPAPAHQQVNYASLPSPFNEQSNSARYPNIPPYSPPNERMRQQISYLDSTDYGNLNHHRPPPSTGSVMQTVPSFAMSFHESQDRQVDNNLPASHYHQRPAEVDSLSGSGSGSHYAFKQQPKQVSKDDSSATSNNDIDHMLAIERFSKQPSERRPPSMVHPITGEQVQVYHQTTASKQQRQQEANQTVPRRFSSMLIDKHVVASDEPQHQQPTSEILETEQSAQEADLRRLNSSAQLAPSGQNNVRTTPSPVSGGVTISNGEGSSAALGSADNGAKAQMPLATTESVPPVLIRPVGFDFFASDPPATAPVTSAPLTSMSTSTSATSSGSMAGPLVPSFGPPSQKAQAPSGQDEGELVLKSALVEPITSTLMTNMGGQVQASGKFVHNSLNFDSSPFVPIELANYNSQGQQQAMAPMNLFDYRLRSPALIESMLSQYQSPFKPEPPVHVASYLAHHLAGHNPMLVQSEPPVETSQPSSASLTVPTNQQRQQKTGTQTNGNNNATTNAQSTKTSELIILKPAILANQMPQTYVLKPEYLTNQFKPIVGGDHNSINGAAGQGPDLYYTQPNELQNELPTRRLVGHQFDRLSSLSSPPSTSMALDPMQAAQSSHSGATATVIVGRPAGGDQQRANLSSVEQGDNNYSINTAGASGSNTMRPANSSTASTLPPQQRHIPGKLIPVTLANLPSSNYQQHIQDRGLRPNSGGDNINTFYRDNNTDNAILSHVMSLISANAIPTPPLIPVTSYSNADYFLPISDYRTQRSISS